MTKPASSAATNAATTRMSPRPIRTQSYIVRATGKKPNSDISVTC